jgi:uncharacterized repeat protein (TIGR01451 family)
VPQEAAVGTVTNTAMVTANEADSTPTDNTGTATSTVDTPAPVINSLSRSAAVVGSGPVTVAINGSGYVAGISTVQVNSVNHAVTWDSTTQMHLLFSMQELTTAGSKSITVTNPSPGGGISAAVTFTVAQKTTLTATKTCPAKAFRGDTINYTIKATNTGTANAYDVILSDNLPDGTVLDSPIASKVCTATARTVTCFSSSEPVLSATNFGDFRFTVRTDANTPSPVINKASAAAANATMAFSNSCQTILLPPPGVFGTVTLAGSMPSNNDVAGNAAVNFSDFTAAFSSTATNLVSPPTTQQNVFASLCPGIPSAACYNATGTTGRAQISLVSVTAAGAEPNGASGPTISTSKDGRYISYRSFATNLPGPPSSVFVRDTCKKGDGTTVAGCTPATYLGSATDSGALPNNGNLDGALSGDGVMVCFASPSTNMVAGVTTPGQIYCRNTCGGPNTPLTGCTASTFLVSKKSSGTGASDFGGNYPVVSSDGRFVCYQGTATDLVAGVTISGQFYCTDACRTSAGTVASCTQTNILVSQGNDGKPCTGGCTSHGPPFAPPKPAMSDDGRFVVFNVDGAIALLPNDTNNKPDVYLRDTCRNSSGPVTGCTPTTSVISVGLDGNAANDQSLAGAHSISADGRFVVFDSLATNIVTGTFPAGQTFVRDTCGGASGPVAGCAPKTIRIPVESSGGSPAGGGSSIEGNGHFVVTSVATGCPSACRLQLALFATGF